MRMTRLAVTLLFSTTLVCAQQWRQLFNGKNLDGWEVRGDGVWTVLKDGTLAGLRPHRAPFKTWPISRQEYQVWSGPQAWLYTTSEFDQFDLHVEYWLPPGGNSGVSIRDTSRGRYALTGPEHDSQKTPSHLGYEIQILAAGESDKNPTGSIYNIAQATKGFQHEDDWNSLDIESRTGTIRTKLNDHAVAEAPSDPARPAKGPIGLQLHDRFSWILFRNIKIREVR